MASLREIKQRIASVRNTLKITSAMKMVASAKLSKAQKAIAGHIPYELKLHHILSSLIQNPQAYKAVSSICSFEESADVVPDKNNVARVALVLFSSNSSLCGAFNMNAIRMFNTVLDRLHGAGYSDGDIDLYTVGRKIAENVRRQGLSVKKDFSDMPGVSDYQKATGLHRILMDEFGAGRIGRVILIYNHMNSAASQPTVSEVYLPLPLVRETGEKLNDDVIVEPDPVSIVQSLLPKVILLKMYTVIMDANAAEHAARTLAMQVASDNAEDLLQELTLVYNKGRQQAITNEILDIVGGSAANNQ